MLSTFSGGSILDPLRDLIEDCGDDNDPKLMENDLLETGVSIGLFGSRISGINPVDHVPNERCGHTV